jgi:hypothetical protein
MQRILMLALVSASVWAQSADAPIPPTPVLNQEQVQLLEAKVAQDPADLASQAILGRNYAFFILGVTAVDQYGDARGFDPAKARGAFARHARNELMNTRFAGVCGEAGQALWHSSFEAERYQSLHQTGERGRVKEARSFGVQVLDRAIALEPGTPLWRSYRIPILHFRATSLSYRVPIAYYGVPILHYRTTFSGVMPLTRAEAYRQIKEDMTLLTGALREEHLATAAKAALNASALEDARAYAQEMLAAAQDTEKWIYGDHVFFGNMVLGQVALRNGDIESAKTFLLASGKTPGSPVLGSFGPNMSLAKELLDARETDTVLKFFDQCEAFWTRHGGRLYEWAATAKRGEVPDFGANMTY